MDASKVKLIPIEEFRGDGHSLKVEDTGALKYNAGNIEASGDEFWAVQIAAKRRGMTFEQYIWACAVQVARTEV
jgi:hypothetical protein